MTFSRDLYNCKFGGKKYVLKIFVFKYLLLKLKKNSHKLTILNTNGVKNSRFG